MYLASFETSNLVYAVSRSPPGIQPAHLNPPYPFHLPLILVYYHFYPFISISLPIPNLFRLPYRLSILIRCPPPQSQPRYRTCTPPTTPHRPNAPLALPTPHNLLLPLEHLHLLYDLPANIPMRSLHRLLHKRHHVPARLHLDILDQHPFREPDALPLALDFALVHTPLYDPELRTQCYSRDIRPRFYPMRRVLKAARERDVFLAQLADPREDSDGLGYGVRRYGPQVGRVPVCVLFYFWVRGRQLDVACGEGLQGQAGVVVVQCGDHV